MISSRTASRFFANSWSRLSWASRSANSFCCWRPLLVELLADQFLQLLANFSFRLLIRGRDVLFSGALSPPAALPGNLDRLGQG